MSWYGLKFRGRRALTTNRNYAMWFYDRVHQPVWQHAKQTQFPQSWQQVKVLQQADRLNKFFGFPKYPNWGYHQLSYNVSDGNELLSTSAKPAPVRKKKQTKQLNLLKESSFKTAQVYDNQAIDLKVAIDGEGRYGLNYSQWSWCLVDSNGELQEAHGQLSHWTENGAQVYCLLQVLQQLVNHHQNGESILIESNSQYLLGAATEWIVNWQAHGWKRKHGLAYAEQWQQIGTLIQSFSNLYMQWAPHHEHDGLTRRAHQLCQFG